MLIRVLPFVVVLSGCYKVKVEGFQDSGGPGTTVVKPAHTVIGGLVTLNDIDAEAACGDRGVWSVQTSYNGISFLVSAFTLGIYFPMYAQITCASGS